MPKRAADDARPGPEKTSRRTSGQAREKPPEEMGEFEDAWEDEIDDDDAAHSDGACLIFFFFFFAVLCADLTRHDMNGA
jgi:hypothetical protein